MAENYHNFMRKFMWFTLVQHFFDAHILSRLFLTNIFPVKCFGC